MLYVDEYNRLRYDSILVRFDKGEGDVVREAARLAGQSANTYIVQAVRDRMEGETGNE